MSSLRDLFTSCLGCCRRDRAQSSVATPPNHYEAVRCETERVENYRPGGFHPVRYEDVLRAHYRVLRKLGFGASSTVWLCKDERANRYVALKILAAESAAPCHELRTLKALARGTSHAGRNHVLQLLDYFEHRGPNGRHQHLYSLPYERGKSLPLSFKRQVYQKLVVALDYLHIRGIMHRDIHQGNILFALNYQIDGLSEQEVQCDLDAIENEYKANGVMVQRVDGQPLTNGEPEYLLEPIPLKDNVPATALPPKLRIILADFGASCRFKECNDGHHAFPFLLQAPEVILKLPLGEKADI